MSKYHYQTARDSDAYLSDTIIFKKNDKRPLYVYHVFESEEGKQKIHYTYLDSLDKEHKTEFLADSFEIKKFPRLGYINVNNSSFYMLRVPVRGAKQGLHSNNTKFYFHPSSSPHNRMQLGSLITTESSRNKSLINLFSNSYPSIEEAEEFVRIDKAPSGIFDSVSLDLQAVGSKSMAFSKVLALSSPWTDTQREHNLPVLLYKNSEVGYGSRYNGFVLDQKYTYLRELIEEHNLKVA